jgi:hypothetical protein
MNQHRKHRIIKRTAAVLFVLAAIAGGRLVFYRPAFDADKVGGAEARMWQAYYTGSKAEIALELISLLRNQHGLSLPQATAIANQLAAAAMKFHSARGNYEQIVLGDLTEAYRLIGQASGAAFNPEEVARAELAWWVARRIPGQNSAEQVGEKIAELYGLIFEKDPAAFRTAGLRRAQAARLRDSGGKDADWPRIENLLKESYRELNQAL